MARRDGDWDCPNCHDMQFASRSACRKCGAAKPDGAGGDGGGFSGGGGGYGDGGYGGGGG
eukprot:CAMPEP_0203811982 /NCGR_PEP_ID=MMETSP0115-20131106/3885_1 /ASSEMBLY_ACC=CAM_ASM_000227 /TAXON_ID=33651 /ORGANISM="Bicosoecid sp, Strain ms1" /LENGTH=59 /DNA_ID=CAMNT_0050720819 /DNA_START=35 /DNA_END=211 /DNA_ORIENTATION=+